MKTTGFTFFNTTYKRRILYLWSKKTPNLHWIIQPQLKRDSPLHIHKHIHTYNDLMVGYNYPWMDKIKFKWMNDEKWIREKEQNWRVDGDDYLTRKLERTVKMFTRTLNGISQGCESVRERKLKIIRKSVRVNSGDDDETTLSLSIICVMGQSLNNTAKCGNIKPHTNTIPRNQQHYLKLKSKCVPYHRVDPLNVYAIQCILSGVQIKYYIV